VEIVTSSSDDRDQPARAQRAAGLTLTGLLSLTNAWSATLLVLGLVHGREGPNATALAPPMCDAAVTMGQTDHVRPGAGLAGDHCSGHRPHRQHSQITALT
jgi:hypothetical protein